MVSAWTSTRRIKLPGLPSSIAVLLAAVIFWLGSIGDGEAAGARGIELGHRTRSKLPAASSLYTRTISESCNKQSQHRPSVG